MRQTALEELNDASPSALAWTATDAGSSFQEDTKAASAVGPAPAKVSSRLLWKIARASLVVDLLIAALIGGLMLRVAVWNWTAGGSRGLRSGDIENGYRWGLAVYNNAAPRQNVDWRGRRSPSSWKDFARAYLNIYDEIEKTAPEGRFGLDYGPGRLLTMALWVRHERIRFPMITTWQPQYAYSAPLLRFNTACELAGAIAAFFLVRFWLRKGGMHSSSTALSVERGNGEDAIERLPEEGWWSFAGGLLAALLVWFNPAILPDAHIWPQWDVWVMPFYLWALYFGSTRRWFIAGAIAGVGIMFKGQLLFAIPFLILWPLFAARPKEGLRFVVGFIGAVAVVTCGWLVKTPVAWSWVGQVAASGVGILCLAKVPRGWKVAMACLLAGLLYWPWLMKERPTLAALAACGAVSLLIVGLMFLPRRALPVGLAALSAGSLFAAGWMFHGSRCWFDLGFGYGTYKHLSMSNNSCNLPALLASPPFNWKLADVVWNLRLKWVGLNWSIPMRSLLGLSYFLSVGLCALGAARKERKRDPAILITFVAPWVLLFALMPQMHQRYLLWGAVFSAVFVAISPGMFLMHLLLTALAAATIFNQLLNQDPAFAPRFHRVAVGLYPGSGWLVILMASILLYRSIEPTRPLPSVR